MDRARAAAIRGFFDQMRGAAGAVIVVTLYMVATAWPYTAWPSVAGWMAVQAVNQLIRVGLLVRWRRAAPHDAALDRWAAVYTAHMAMSGAVWGSTMFLFAHPGQPITVALTVCALYGVSAGSMPGQAYHPPALYALVTPIYLAILVRLAATGNGGYILLGVASIVFAVTMVVFCRNQARVLDESYLIRFENEELLAAVSREKAVADAASLAKSQVLAAASHDLRQPLYALGLFSASLGEATLDAASRAVVVNIQDSIAAMESLFEGLLDVSKLDAGVIRATLVPVSVDALFDRLSQVFRPIALERQLDLRFRCDNVTIISDTLLIEQVLANLVTNALRATTRGGVLVAARVRGERVDLEVWDTGIGIATADQERIFAEFVQLRESTRDQRKGLGLGLSIARRAAALIGSSITIASKPGIGSRFAVSQPIVAASASRMAIGSARRRSLTSIRRMPHLPVLIIDDDSTVRAAIGNLLTRWNVAFDLVADSAAALAAIEAGQRYGLVLSDYRLAESMDGLALIAAIRVVHPTPIPPAILITGDMDLAVFAAANERDVTILPKPLHADDLRTIFGLAVV